jgi:hypothetical protein
VRFDDRLMTVLDQPASDPRDRAIRWRQLVDLVARAGTQAHTPLVQRALEVIRSDGVDVDEGLRAAAARAVAALPLPFGLLELFASDRLAVSAPLLAAANLKPAEWSRLIAAADEETRSFIATLRPELAEAGQLQPAGEAPIDAPIAATDPPSEASPAPEQPPELPSEPAPAPQESAEPPQPSPPPRQRSPALPHRPRETAGPSTTPVRPPSGRPAIPSITEMVARIERLRQGRTSPEPVPQRPAQRPGAPLFRWECAASGEISWVEGVPRGPLIGRSIARADEGEGVAEEVERAFAMRAPFRDARFLLSGEGGAAGEWKISGIPAFDPTSGRFEGYRGIALREAGGSDGAGGGGQTSLLTDPNSLRELVHEIKTPLNAIIGFAEIIDGQYLGPADQQYRNRAAEIVAQARLLLSAIDDLDFSAKLQADRDRAGSGTDLSVLLEQIAAGMRQGASPDAPRLDILVETKRRRCALDPALAERLVTRFCGALLSAAADGAVVQLHLDSSPGQCLLWAARPRLRGRGEADDLGFGLRLVRGLARIAGGDLTIAPARISLSLPEL